MKTKITALSFCLLLIILFSSCRTYLSPAVLGSNMSYIPRAMAADSVKTLSSVSLSYGGGGSPDGKASFEYGMANITHSHTFKTFNLAFGIFGYTGKASGGNEINPTDHQGDYLPTFNKSTQGAGFRFSTGLHHTSANENTDFRFINFENALSFEGGDYMAFRNQLYNSKIPTYVAVSNKRVIWTTGISSEVTWRARRNHDIKHAFRLFIGGTPGLANSFKYGSAPGSALETQRTGGWVFDYHLNVKGFTLSYEVANLVNYSQKLTLGCAF